MKLNQLRNVLEIAERGSLRAAARSLQFAQPALTRSLQEIEHELGAPLFERRARGMVLTPLGQAFVRRAHGVLEEVRRIREEAEQIRGGGIGNVRVGLSIATHIALLPHALGTFRKRYPAVNLNLVEGLYPTVEASLLDGSMDFYVGPEADPATAAGLVQTILADNDRIVLARKGHPLQKARSLAELKDAEWASTFVTLSARDELDTLFARYRLGKPRLALRAESALSLMVAVGYSDLLAMVPVQWTQFEMMSDVLQPIQVREKLPAPRLAFVRRAALPLTPAAEHFAELLIGSLRRAVPAAARVQRRGKASALRADAKPALGRSRR